jgi:hypothetical protein
MELARDIFAFLGGAVAVIYLVAKIAGRVLQDRAKERARRNTELDLESARQHWAVRRKQLDRYAETQYDKYIELWGGLQGMRLAVDSLWGCATAENVESLSARLVEVREYIENWSLFFSSGQLAELRSVVDVLEQFNTGKWAVIEIGIGRRRETIDSNIIQAQIEDNRNLKLQFETLLEDIGASFKRRLSENVFGHV